MKTHWMLWSIPFLIIGATCLVGDEDLKTPESKPKMIQPLMSYSDEAKHFRYQSHDYIHFQEFGTVHDPNCVACDWYRRRGRR